MLIPSILSICFVFATGPASAQPGTTPAPPGPTTQPSERDKRIKQIEDLRGAGKFDEAFRVAQRSLELETGHGDSNRARIAEALSRLAEIHELRGEWDRAIDRFSEALSAREGADGKEHWRTTNARLARVFAERVSLLALDDRARLTSALRREQEVAQLEAVGKSAEAEKTARSVIECYKKLIGPETVEIARIWHQLGRARLGRNDARGAQEANEQALAVRRKAFPVGHPDLAASLNNLGLAEKALGNHQRAQEVLKEAVVIWQLSLGLSDPITAMGLTNLGQVQEELHEFAAAKASYELALAIRRKTLSADDRRIAQALLNLGAVQSQLGEHTASKRSCEELLTIYRRFRAADDADIALCLGNLAFEQFQLKDFLAAKANYTESVAIYRKRIPADHEDVAFILNGLGLVQTELGEHANAKESFKEALAIRRKALPVDDPKFVESLSNFALAQSNSQDFSGAKVTYEELLATLRRSLPANHPDIVRSLITVGSARRRARDYDGAKASYSEALTIYRAVPPKHQVDIAALITELGSVQYLLSDFNGAKASAEEAIRIYQADERPEHQSLAVCFHILANSQVWLRDFSGAVTSYESAIENYRKDVVADALTIAECLHCLGKASVMLGNEKRGRESLSEALAVRRKRLPEGQVDFARNLLDLGVLLLNLDEFADASTILQEALVANTKLLPADHPEIASTLEYLGTAQMRLKQYDLAKETLERSLTLRRKFVPPVPLDVADSLSELGQLYFAQKQGLIARRYFEEALVACRENPTQDDARVATVLSRLGRTQHILLDYRAAKASISEALAIRRRVVPREHRTTAGYLSSLGSIQMDLQLYDDALKSYEEALALDRAARAPDRNSIAGRLHDVACAKLGLGRLSEARTDLQNAIAMWRSALPPGDHTFAAGLYNLGKLQYQAEDYEGAKKSLEEAISMWRNAIDERSNTAICLNLLARTYLQLCDLRAAEKAFEDAFIIGRNTLPKGHETLAGALVGLGAMRLRLDFHVEDAVKYLTAAVDIVYAEHLRMAFAQTEREQLKTGLYVKACLNGLIDSSVRCSRSIDSTYDRVVQVKGSVTARQRWARLARGDAEPGVASLLTQLRHVNRQIVRLAAETTRVSETADDTQLTATIKRTCDERDQLERELSDRSTTYRDTKDKERVGAREIRAALPDGAILIDFVNYIHEVPLSEGPKRPTTEHLTAAFLTRPDLPNVAVVPLGPSKPLFDLISKWRASFGTGRTPATGAPDPGAELRRKIWQPLTKYLEGIKVVLISSDGALNGLPWAALPGSKSGTFLVHEYAFSSIPVPQLLPELLKHEARVITKAPSLLLAGGIDFGESKPGAEKVMSSVLTPVRAVGPLPGSESEVNDLRTQFEDTFPDALPPKRLSKDKATKPAVLTELPTHEFIHLATHGFFAAESEDPGRAVFDDLTGNVGEYRFRPELTWRQPGLLSGLIFAGFNLPDRAPEDTILTALEAADLNLEKVKLVTLSACDTGRGLVAGGEGVLGLQRAFQLAGARSVLASLWKVPDEETHQLMREFYRRIWSKDPISKAEALRQAQLWMLENWKPRGTLNRPAPEGPPSPYYWAAFVLSGDWR